jgi:hypothetical protein
VAGSGIPAKGPGNVSPKAAPFTSETAKEASAKAGFLRKKFAAWRAENPDAPLTMMERDRLIREGLRESAEARLDVMIEVALDKNHKDFAPTSRVLAEHDLGKPRQAIELAGKDGSALVVQVVKFANDQATE